MSSNRFGAGFTGANANGFGYLGDKNFAVSDFPRACRIGDGFDDLLRDCIVDGQFNLGFREEVDDVLGAAV